jgi:hypothetical protein
LQRLRCAIARIRHGLPALRGCPGFGRGIEDRVVAVILALLLGGLGVHKFYLGRIGWGVVYLVFCWTFIPSLLGLIEGIIYAFMSDADFHAKYG